jgi:hypothetical protein
MTTKPSYSKGHRCQEVGEKEMGIRKYQGVIGDLRFFSAAGSGSSIWTGKFYYL